MPAFIAQADRKVQGLISISASQGNTALQDQAYLLKFQQETTKINLINQATLHALKAFSVKKEALHISVMYAQLATIVLKRLHIMLLSPAQLGNINL